VVGVSLHIDIPTRAQIAALLEARADAGVSIYLPTSPLPQDAEAARIEFKNLAAEALRQLDGNAAVREQLDDLAEDEAFWRSLASSLAVFATPDSLRTFRLPNRLTSMVEVSDRFHVKPLLRSVTFPQVALVLALAQNSVRVRQYARAVDRALRPLASDLPLILAAAEPLASIFRAVNGSAHLLPEGIAGNPEAMSAAELADAARPILDALYASELVEVRRRFERRAEQGRGATDLTDVARAATFGAVETLMTDIDEVVPGFVDADSGAITLDRVDDAANYGVVDEIARRVLESGGRVLALRREDIPAADGVAAILRYPV
jgi:hypothetical protein